MIGSEVPKDLWHQMLPTTKTLVRIEFPLRDGGVEVLCLFLWLEVYTKLVRCEYVYCLVLCWVIFLLGRKEIWSIGEMIETSLFILYTWDTWSLILGAKRWYICNVIYGINR